MNNNFFLEQISKTGDPNVDLIMRQNNLDKMAKFLEIKSINPKLKQSGIAKELKISTCTIQRHGREMNMLSPYRISPNTNYTRKQKISNINIDDVKLSSKDLKMTTNDTKTSSNEPVRPKKNKLKGGDPSKICICGKDFIERAFSSNQMDEFIEIIKKILIYKMTFHLQLISTTKNHFYHDLKQAKCFISKQRF